MIDFEKIGARIAEERKLVHNISQRKMAEDLNMYQADISNLEKAKNGSGITDLYKLDLVAEYLQISTESLIFGSKKDSMLKYYGNTMELIRNEEPARESHKIVIGKLTGLSDTFSALPNDSFYKRGPYSIYSVKQAALSRIQR